MRVKWEKGTQGDEKVMKVLQGYKFDTQQCGWNYIMGNVAMYMTQFAD